MKIEVVQIRLPAPPAGLDWRPPAELSALLGNLKNQYSPTDLIGWECQAVAENVWLGPATFTSSSGPRASILRRPASEIGLCGFWENLKQWDVRASTIRALQEILLGGAPELRTGPIHTVANRSNVALQFPPIQDAMGWREELQGASELDMDPFLFALFAMVLIIVQHPYKDGNGRLARAMFQGALAHKGLIGAPILPLGPCLHANKHGLAAGLIALSETGCWATYADLHAVACVEMLTRLNSRVH